jgi:NTP pyrophosphatase (non-canonical NTP hydrolase)
MARAFAEEFHRKFIRRAAERKRSLTPWSDFEFIELFERLQEETSELYEAIFEEKDMEAVMDECKDVANFAWFMYEQAKLKLEQGA